MKTYQSRDAVLKKVKLRIGQRYRQLHVSASLTQGRDHGTSGGRPTPVWMQVRKRHIAALAAIRPVYRQTLYWLSYTQKGDAMPVQVQESEAPWISRQSAPEGGKVVSPTHRPPLTPPPHQKRSLLFISHSGRVDSRALVRQEGLSQ